MQFSRELAVQNIRSHYAIAVRKNTFGRHLPTSPGEVGPVTAQALVVSGGRRALLLANPRRGDIHVALPGWAGAEELRVDASAGVGAVPYARGRLAGEAGHLGGLAVHLLLLPAEVVV